MLSRVFFIKTKLHADVRVGAIMCRGIFFRNAVTKAVEYPGYENQTVLSSSFNNEFENTSPALRLLNDGKLVIEDSPTEWIKSSLKNPEFKMIELIAEADREHIVRSVGQLRQNCSRLDHRMIQRGVSDDNMFHLKHVMSSTESLLIFAIGHEKPNMSMLPQIF